MADSPPHHCKDCGLVFDSGKSLDVHLHYHKENLLSKWASQQQQQQQQQPNDESNNNNHVHHKKTSRTSVLSSQPDSSDSRYFQYVSPPAQPPPEESGYVLGSGAGFPLMSTARTPTPNSSSSPSPHHNGPPSTATNNPYRYHPYQQYSVAPSPDHHRNGLVSSSSPQQCDKCGYICESTVQLMEHNAVSHPTVEHMFHQQNHPHVKSEQGPSQAEILDLDSHKVHVYQPPRPQDRSVSALMSWVNDVDVQRGDKEHQRFHHPQNSGLASPDCYGGAAVSTTTLTPPDPSSDTITRHRPGADSYHQQFDHLPLSSSNPQQISSTQLQPPAVSQQAQSGGGKATKNGSGGSWKSNEARRPKTYNCSACNKWFTSSGHLKRHYNTTLHKNAVKSSGVPDPASMPISVHHHPQKEPSYNAAASPSPLATQPEAPSPQPEEQQQSQPPPQSSVPPPVPVQTSAAPQHFISNHLNHFLPSPPNLMAGSSEVTGGLLLHTTPFHQELLTQHHTPGAIIHQATSSPPGGTTFLPFSQPPPTHPTYSSPPANPNFQPPHVSTIGQLATTTTSSITGNLNLADIQLYLSETGKQQHEDDSKPLPSFSQQFQHSLLSHFSPVVSSSQSSVGGPHNIPTYSNFIQPINLSPNPPDFDDNIFYQTISRNDATSTTANNNSKIKMARPDITIKDEPQNYDETEYPSSTQQIIMEKTAPFFNMMMESVNDVASTTMIKIEENHETRRFELDDVAGIKTEDTSQVSSTIEATPQEALAEKPNANKIYRCIDCDKIFNKVCYLTQHNKSFHSGNKPYKCERCGKRFLAEDQHQQHIIKHAGDKPYKCEMCPKQFNHKTDLRRHMCLHTGDKPFACDTCGKGFIRKDHMLKHCETHRRKKVTPPSKHQPSSSRKMVSLVKQQQPQQLKVASSLKLQEPQQMQLQQQLKMVSSSLKLQQPQQLQLPKRLVLQMNEDSTPLPPPLATMQLVM